MQPRRARRIDANANEIAKAFERMGCTVHRTNGAWDLTIGHGGMTRLIEVKDGKKSPSARALTDAEAKFHASWTGGIRIVKDLDDVQEAVKALREQAGILQSFYSGAFVVRK